MGRGIRKTVRDYFHRLSKRHSRRNLRALFVESLRAHNVRAGSEVLNIGAGGEITDILNEEGISFTSVDIDPAMKPDIVMDITDMAPIPDDSIDVII